MNNTGLKIRLVSLASIELFQFCHFLTRFGKTGFETFVVCLLLLDDFLDPFVVFSVIKLKFGIGTLRTSFSVHK